MSQTLSLLFLSIIELILSATPQPPAVKWVTGYSVNGCESHAHAGVQSTDGGFFMAGDGVCYGHTDKIHRHVAALKTDSTGNKLWDIAIGTTGYNYGKWAIQLNDGNFVISGSKSVVVHGSKCGYIEYRALWVLSKINGSILSETLYPNNGESQNLRDGMMCINQANSSIDEYIATGYIGSESGCNDEPMFLIFGGYAFLMKLKYDLNTNKFNVLYEVIFNQSKILTDMIPMQGMRVFDDYSNKRYGISTATHTPTDYNVQFGMISTDYNGNVLWNAIYPATNKYNNGTASHPYALTLSTLNDGWVISGLALKQSNGIPEGRMAKIGYKGDLIWDTRFEYNNDTDMSVECYGISITKDNGYITTCGTGYEGPNILKLNDENTWMALLHRTDKNGVIDWQKCYTNQTEVLGNAGEFVITTKDWGYAMYMDCGEYGPDANVTGGNFGLMLLYPDD
eukprot:221747_1